MVGSHKGHFQLALFEPPNSMQFCEPLQHFSTLSSNKTVFYSPVNILETLSDSFTRPSSSMQLLDITTKVPLSPVFPFLAYIHTQEST